VGRLGDSVPVPALPEVSPSRGGAIVASLLGRAIILCILDEQQVNSTMKVAMNSRIMAARMVHMPTL